MLLGRFYEDISIDLEIEESTTVIFGITLTLILGTLADKGGKYKKYLIVCIMGNLGGLAIMLFALNLDDSFDLAF